MRIYYFENVSYIHKGWDAVFKQLTQYLQKTYNAEIRYKSNFNAEEGTYFYIEEFDYKMKDCELIIYDEENDILKAISFSEFHTGLWFVFTKRNKKEDLALITQFDDWYNREIYTGEVRMDVSQFNFTLGSTVFYTLMDSVDYETLYAQRKYKSFTDLKDKLFMLFTTQRADPYTLSQLGYLNDDLTPVHTEEYFQKVIDHKIGLAMATTAEYCYREIEYMAVGVPFMRLEYLRQLDPPLIPNFHYIAVDRAKNELPYNTGLDRQGGEKFVKAYIDRFLEVKDDQEFLDFIAKNAREYYLAYCSPQNRIQHVLSLLKID